MNGDNDNKGTGFALGGNPDDEGGSPYSHRKEEEVRSFYALSLATILLAAPFGLAVILLERPIDDPIMISVYFWLGLAALVYYPFVILRSPADIYIADAYDDTASRTARIAGIALFAYALLWGVNLLMLTNGPPWRTAQGPLARITDVITTDKWTEKRSYEFRFQLNNVPGWFIYHDQDQTRITSIHDRMMHVERGGPFIMADDEEDTVTPSQPVSIADAVKQAEEAAPKPDPESELIAAPVPEEIGPDGEVEEVPEDKVLPPGGTNIEETDAIKKKTPARLSVGFRADHGWVNAIVPPAWAFLGENTRMDIKAMMLDDELVVFDLGRALSLRVTSLIWFVMCVLAGSASFLAARLRSLKGQEAEANKHSMMSRRAEETRAFEAKLAELGLHADHLTEIQKAALINPLHKKQDQP